jgi:hypothetical protein
MNPTPHSRHGTIRQPATNALGFSCPGLNLPVFNSWRLIDLPTEQPAVEIRQLRRVFGVDFKVRD